MFFFGEADSGISEMMIKERGDMSGPGFPVAPRKYWGMRQYQAAMIYASSTLRQAYYDNQPEELLHSLCDAYEEYLTEFCKYSDVVYRAMELNLHQFPWNNDERKARQRGIAKAALEK
jgi:hypothetical protein